MPRFTSHKRTLPNKQQGAALLLFVLLLIVGTSTLLVSKLNKAATQPYRDDVTMKALIKAKEALIGYAVSYPDLNSTPGAGNPGTTQPEAGPGYLPCPDSDYPPNGSPNSCSSDSLGRLPWEFLDIDDIRDSSGELLWYTLSGEFRNIASKFAPINSETQGALTVDGANDIVAIIFAPGIPTQAQSARPSNTPADYLEGDNITSGDHSFASDGNDRLLVITRQELMAAVEKRVLGEASQVLRNYRKSYGDNKTYPLLSEFANPRVHTALPTPTTVIESSKSITGLTSVGSSGNSLVDTTKDFGLLNVKSGDIVAFEKNLNDFRLGTVNVSASSGQNSLSLTSLSDEYPMDLVDGADYTIARFNGDSTNPLKPQQGLISHHASEEPFKTSFRSIWHISGANEAVCSQIENSAPSFSAQSHIDNLTNSLRLNDLFFDISNPSEKAACVWSGESVVDCLGEKTEAFAIPASASATVVQCSSLLPLQPITSITQRQYTVRLKYIGDSTTPIDSSTPTPLTSGLKTRNVFTNLPQASSVIELTIRDLDTSGQVLGEAKLELSGAETGSISTNNIHYDLAETGGLVSAITSSTITDTQKNFIARGVLPGQWIESPTIPNARGRISSVTPTTVTFTSVGSPSLTFSTSFTSNRYKIYNELPKWFTYNNWHQLTLVAVSSENIPGGSGSCSVGSCINISDANGTIAGSNNTNKEAIVIAAGGELSGTSPPQDRVLSGSIDDYFEKENNNGDQTFYIHSFNPVLNVFNDQIKRVAPCLSPNEIDNCY